ncbi:DsbA family protein [Novosphingobium sp. ST904]|uniref:DsbA family protein n=3 Tax=Sphingomonadaceae TaxID=41297 RepID=UPI0006C8654F|nr:DsbA family protein [Novosphingobium sp. ST904]TCM41304.1 protein-disulfide isomerase [Novosphingobium sp. ST904]
MKLGMGPAISGLAIALAAFLGCGQGSLDARAETIASPQERARMKEALANDPGVPILAPQGYDVTVVVFSDYQCPYCRKFHADLNRLLASDRKLRVVYRDWPIFGGLSREAARVAMATRYQGKHAAFNDALMAGPVKLDATTIRQAAARAGVDWPRLQTDLKLHGNDIDAALQRTGRLAETLGLSGTPSLVIGDYLIPGAIDFATLQRVVQKSRSGKP